MAKKKSLSEQVEAIKKIVGGRKSESSIPHWRISFGKYKGRYFDSVLESDPQYVEWLYHSGMTIPKKVEEYIAKYVVQDAASDLLQ